MMDASKFLRKLNKIKVQVPIVAAAQVAGIAQMIFDKTKVNLKGASVGVRTSSGGLQYAKTPPAHPLRMPVRRVTGTLARSLKMIPMSKFEYFIYCDSQIAKYASYVHSGTKYIKPRRFLGDVIKKNKIKSVKELDEILMSVMK